MWQSRVENVHYSGNQFLRKSRLKFIVCIPTKTKAVSEIYLTYHTQTLSTRQGGS